MKKDKKHAFSCPINFQFPPVHKKSSLSMAGGGDLKIALKVNSELYAICQNLFLYFL